MSGAGGVGGARGGGGHGHGSHGAHSVHGSHAAHGAHKAAGSHQGGQKSASVDHANRCVNGQHSPGSPGKTPFPNTKSANDFLAATSKGSIQSAHWQSSGSHIGMSVNQAPTIIVIMAGGQSFGYVFSSDENWEYKGDQAQKTASANNAPRVGVQHNHEASHGQHHGHSPKSSHGHHSGHHGSHGVQHSHSGHGHHSGHMKAGKGGGHGGGGRGGGGGGK